MPRVHTLVAVGKGGIMIKNKQFIKIGEDAETILKRIPNLGHRPLANSIDLIEIEKVMKVLPEFKYPIASAGELIEKLGGHNKQFDIEGMKIVPLRMVKYMPAYYFPIFSKENFIEKMAELLRANRKPVDVPEVMTNLKQKLPKIDYPISSAEDLAEKLGPKTVYKFEGKPVTPERMVKYIPSDYFPINSEDEFHKKIIRWMITRPLLIKHE